MTNEPTLRPVRASLTDGQRTAIEAWVHGQRQTAAMLRPDGAFKDVRLTARYGPVDAKEKSPEGCSDDEEAVQV